MFKTVQAAFVMLFLSACGASSSVEVSAASTQQGALSELTLFETRESIEAFMDKNACATAPNASTIACRTAQGASTLYDCMTQTSDRTSCGTVDPKSVGDLVEETIAKQMVSCGCRLQELIYAGSGQYGYTCCCNVRIGGQTTLNCTDSGPAL